MEIKLPVEDVKLYVQEQWDGKSYLNDGEEPRDYGFVELVETSTGRWEQYYNLILCRYSDETFWRTHYSRGLTEAQDYDSFDTEYRDTVTFEQVEQRTKMVEVVEYVRM